MSVFQQREETLLPPCHVVGVIGFEPIQLEAPDLQSGPALPLRRTPIGASGGIRTPDPLITNQLLWPTELHWQVFVNQKVIGA